jgi:predicted DNA-binding transcriptional regulator AlpA
VPAPYLPEELNLASVERSTLALETRVRVLFIEDLASLIGKTKSTIRTFVSRRESYQHLIPPPYKLQGSRRLCWRERDVIRWMESTKPVFPPPEHRRPGRPTKLEQLERQRWAAGQTARGQP